MTRLNGDHFLIPHTFLFFGWGLLIANVIFMHYFNRVLLIFIACCTYIPCIFIIYWDWITHFYGINIRNRYFGVYIRHGAVQRSMCIYKFRRPNNFWLESLTILELIRMTYRHILCNVGYYAYYRLCNLWLIYYSTTGFNFIMRSNNWFACHWLWKLFTKKIWGWCLVNNIKFFLFINHKLIYF